MKTLDARGLSCPEPVVLLRNAMAAQEPAYQIVVDNPTSRENVTRYAEHQGYQVACVEQDGSIPFPSPSEMTYIATFYSHFGAIRGSSGCASSMEWRPSSCRCPGI